MKIGKLPNVAILLVTIAISVFFSNNYGKKATIFYGDALGYYLYLPATFIYHNNTAIYDLPGKKDIPANVVWYLDDSKKNCVQTDKGYKLNQYTYGVALMDAPFFFIAHAYEKAKGLPANGFSDSYSNMIKIGTLLYALLGLLLTYKILRRYFNTILSLMGVCFIFLGTNLFWFSLYQSGMSHVPLFLLYTLLIYLTIRVHEQPKWQLFAAMGLVVGLITLMRPTDIVCLFIPLLYNVYNRSTLLAKVTFIKEHIGKVILLGMVFLIPIIPQLLYWKVLTGHYIFYSYGQQSFNWRHPEIIAGLFYYANGWLAYTPLMYLALLGMLLMRPVKSWTLTLWILLPVYVYIIYSWYCFNYINGFGSRPMIHLYSLLALPLVAFLQYIAQRKLFIKTLAGALAIFFIAINISYSMQQAKGILRSEESNFAYNMQILFRMHIHYKDLVVLNIAERQPDEDNITKIATLSCINYNDSTNDRYVRDTVDGSRFIYNMKKEQFADTMTDIAYDPDICKGAKWLKCSGKFMLPSWPGGYNKHNMTLEIKHDGENIQWTSCQVDNKITHAGTDDDVLIYLYELNKWGEVYFYRKLPKNIQKGDRIRFFIDNAGKEDLYMDDLCVEAYK